MLTTQREETERRVSQQSEPEKLQQHMQTGKADFPVHTSMETFEETHAGQKPKLHESAVQAAVFCPSKQVKSASPS